MSRPARTVTFDGTATDGTSPGQRVTIPATAAGFTMRVVNAAGAGVAWTLGPDTGSQVFHFAAGEAYSPRDLCLDDVLHLRVVAAAGSRVELIVWSA